MSKYSLFFFALTLTLAGSNALSEGCDESACGEILEFEVEPTKVEVNGSLSVSWSSRGMWECFGTHFPNSAWATFPNDPKMPEGTQTFNIGPINPGVYKIRLECTNGPAFDEAIETIQVLPES